MTVPFQKCKRLHLGYRSSGVRLFPSDANVPSFGWKCIFEKNDLRKQFCFLRFLEKNKNSGDKLEKKNLCG